MHDQLNPCQRKRAALKKPLEIGNKDAQLQNKDDMTNADDIMHFDLRLRSLVVSQGFKLLIELCAEVDRFLASGMRESLDE